MVGGLSGPMFSAASILPLLLPCLPEGLLGLDPRLVALALHGSQPGFGPSRRARSTIESPWPLLLLQPSLQSQTLWSGLSTGR